MRLRLTPSGLTMDRVRSAGMSSSRSDGGLAGARILPPAMPSRQSRWARKCPFRKEKSDAEAFAAAALAAHVGVPESEGFVEAMAHEIDLGAVDQAKALGVDQDLHALAVEHPVAALDRVSVVDDVGETGAAGLAYCDAQADSAAPFGEEVPDPVGRGGRERDGHVQRHCIARAAASSAAAASS